MDSFEGYLLAIVVVYFLIKDSLRFPNKDVCLPEAPKIPPKVSCGCAVPTPKVCAQNQLKYHCAENFCGGNLPNHQHINDNCCHDDLCKNFDDDLPCKENFCGRNLPNHQHLTDECCKQDICPKCMSVDCKCGKEGFAPYNQTRYGHNCDGVDKIFGCVNTGYMGSYYVGYRPWAIGYGGRPYGTYRPWWSSQECNFNECM